MRGVSSEPNSYVTSSRFSGVPVAVVSAFHIRKQVQTAFNLECKHQSSGQDKVNVNGGVYTVLVVKVDTTWNRLEGNIKANVKEIECEIVDWSHLGQDRNFC
jgi:hypothetical protein